MSEFLTTVLPSCGLYCAAVFKGEARKHSFYSNVTELSAAIAAVGTEDGPDTYFALASFSEKSRKAENATYFRSVFVDIDCGETKQYSDQTAGAQALRSFLDANSIPYPTFLVNSGSGLHGYWAFDEDIPTAKWLPVSRAFKSLCLSKGLMIDPAVTADAARILRPPGTYNHKKGEARPVQIVARAAIISFDKFKSALPSPAVDLSAARAFGMDQITEDLSKSDLDPCNFARIARKSLRTTNGCAQIRFAIENAATLEEPLWRAALSIAQNCEDGEKSIHKLSSAHPEYNAEATEEKASRLTGKPYTCEWYKTNYSTGCAGCTHKIGSPIVLGRIIKESPSNADGGYTIQTHLDDVALSSQTLPLEMPPLPYGYFRGVNGGVFRRGVGPDGEPSEIEIYPHDLYVEERFYDSDEDGDGEGEQVTVCLNLPRDGMRRFVAPLSTLMAPDTMRNLLTKHGVVAHSKQVNPIMAYLASAIQKLQATTTAHRTRSQMGWTPERHFVVGHIEYTPSGPKLAPPASTVRHLAPWFHQKGTLDGWRSVVQTYNTPGLEPLALAFLIGAGSTLLQLLDAPQVKGGVVHLVSNQSGSGKTTAQLAINSLFGSPVKMLMTEKDTFNAKLQAMGMFNSICMTIDEITAMETREVSELVYSATTGRGKHRMESQSNKLRVNHSSWCMFTVTSANSVLSDILLTHKSAVEGELKRLLELRVVKPEGDVSRDLITRFNDLDHHFGVAGPIFIQHVVTNYDEVSEKLKALHERLVVNYNFDRTDRFYTAMLACAAMAAGILRSLGLVDLDAKRILKYGIESAKASKFTAESAAGNANTVALETLAAFVADNFSHTLVIKSEKAGEAAITVPKGALRIRYEPDTEELVIVAADLRAYFVSRRVDVRTSVREFAEMGALKRGKDGSVTISRRPAAGAQNSSLRGAPTRCYVFDAAKLGLQVLPDGARE